ncbi:plasma membrane fusion protein PRM1 [Thozetella sp. PMI_491]|nr:plasma membrane fusion protein PRM1 [Thozetella sp. PMI_491]
MFGKKKELGDYPPVPASLNANSPTSSNKEQLRPHADTAGSITPYLGLRSRLSQLWFNRWTVLLLLVLVRTLILLASLNDNIGDAKAKALAACTKVEDIGSAMASMPHYLSVGVNSAAAVGVTKAVSGMVSVLSMILTAIPQLLLFIINMYIGTYVCLAAAFIHGGLDVAVAMVQDTTDFINNAIKGISGDISSALDNVQTIINNFYNAISKGASIFGVNTDPPKIDISSDLNKLQTIHVDSTQFVKDLAGLNSTIPSFDQAKNLTESVLTIPFKKVQDLLDQTYGNYSFDSSIFPVAQKKGLSFCSDNSFLNDFFEKLFKIAADAKIAFLVVIIVLALLAIVAQGYLEIRRWRRQQRLARVFTKHGYDPMDVVYIASRPFTSTTGIKLAARFSGKRQLLVRWAVAYGTSLPALFVLSLALAGLFSCLCQLIILKLIQQKTPELANQVGDFANQVVTTLEDVSVTWANDANGVITKMTDEVNNDVFGWVRIATTAVNDTLTTFEDEINKGLDDIFNGTVLYNTVKNVFACLIGNKIDAVEKGLTWVHDQAHVSFPLFPNDTFSQGAQKSIGDDSDLTSFLATPSSVTSDDITAAVDTVVNKLQNGLIQEALISTALLMVYVIIVLIGVVRSLAGMATPGRTRGEGASRATGDRR